jgi:hypothetical protein
MDKGSEQAVVQAVAGQEELKAVRQRLPPLAGPAEPAAGGVGVDLAGLHPGAPIRGNRLPIERQEFVEAALDLVGAAIPP